MMTPEFTTLDEARTYHANTDANSWQFYRDFDKAALVNYLFVTANGERTYDELLSGFLVASGADPADYSL